MTANACKKMIFKYEGDPVQDVANLRVLIVSNGGEFNGDETKGEFFGYAIGFYYKVAYEFKPDQLIIDVIKKPFIFDCSFIEKTIQDYIDEAYFTYSILGGVDARIYLDQSQAPISNVYLWDPIQRQGGSNTIEINPTPDYQLGDGANLDSGKDPRLPTIDSSSGASVKGNTLYEAVLADWLDPFSPPHVRTKCIRSARTDFPPISTCIEWKVQKKYVYNRAVLVVKTKTEQEIKKAIDDCLKQSAIAAALAIITTGGSAALQAAEAAFKICLGAKLGAELLSVNIKTNSRRGGWE